LFHKDAGKIPTEGYPLMASTRNAVSQLTMAKRLPAPARLATKQRRIAMI